MIGANNSTPCRKPTRECVNDCYKSFWNCGENPGFCNGPYLREDHQYEIDAEEWIPTPSACCDEELQ